MNPVPPVLHGRVLDPMAWYQLLRSEWSDPEFRGLCVLAGVLLLFS